ncbi:SDR family oxidoreductase [Yaniella flava]|uniref:SDR family oxidoreductase n=1 Tax=Yaniella flava TaxID=287930 RepID=A0ABN2ULS2_9MICC|nr:SDR family NAD(P)-dependent oxidoreductase [Micrococcaceae bacterium]
METTDRTVLITGATSGLGRAVAESVAQRPGRLILHGRDAERLNELATELSSAKASIELVTAELDELSQVHDLVDKVFELTDHLDVLVNNAGIGKGATDTRQESADGFELRTAVNHLAPFVLSLRLLPLLETGAPSRIVNVASGAQQPLDFEDPQVEHNYTGDRAYGQSKFVMIATGFFLANKLPAEVVTVNSLHPATLMPTRMVEEGYGHTVDDLATGVDAVLHLIESEALESVTGQYFSGQQRAEAHPQAYDPDVQQRLWKLTEELTGVQL